MSDHIPDLTKMIGDTPRTDATYFKPDATMYDLAGEMKRIERELNEVTKERDEAVFVTEKVLRDFSEHSRSRCKALDELITANDRIKRLEEGGDEAIYPFEYAARVRIWTKAKEAKP